MKAKHSWRLWLLTGAEESLLVLSKEDLYIFQLLASQYYSA